MQQPEWALFFKDTLTSLNKRQVPSPSEKQRWLTKERGGPHIYGLRQVIPGREAAGGEGQAGTAVGDSPLGTWVFRCGNHPLLRSLQDSKG